MSLLDDEIKEYTTFLEGVLQKDANDPYGTWKAFVNGINRLRQIHEDEKLQSTNKVAYELMKGNAL